MVNQSDFADSQSLRDRFREDDGSQSLSFVRIATVLGGLPTALEMAADLRDSGFEVFVNLMQISSVDLYDLESALGSGLVTELTGLYLADSFGALKPEEMSALVKVAVRSARVPVGVHCHDNLGLAYANSRAAYQSGARFIDGTVLGLGRGAGNARTELLALEYLKIPSNMVLSALTETWRSWVRAEERLPEWGPSLAYGLAATRGVHPTYVQTMMESQSFEPPEIIKVVEELGEEVAAKYSEPMLDIGADWFSARGFTSEGLTKRFEGKTLILVGGGSSVVRYQEEISQLVSSLDSVVCAVGGRTAWPFRVDYHIISHPTTMLSRPNVLSSDIDRIGPFSQMPPEIAGTQPMAKQWSVDLCLTQDRFGFDGERLYSPSSRSSIFGLIFAAGLDVDSVFLVGFDGYPPGDIRNQEFEDTLARLGNQRQDLFSLTPTIFNVPFHSFVW
ncbi:hypothetical protein N9K72_03890 [Pontimonas sp.]|nr:hypothetical protein [Pontimonas sp.]